MQQKILDIFHLGSVIEKVPIHLAKLATWLHLESDNFEPRRKCEICNRSMRKEGDDQLEEIENSLEEEIIMWWLYITGYKKNVLWWPLWYWILLIDMVILKIVWIEVVNIAWWFGTVAVSYTHLTLPTICSV